MRLLGNKCLGEQEVKSGLLGVEWNCGCQSYVIILFSVLLCSELCWCGRRYPATISLVLMAVRHASTVEDVGTRSGVVSYSRGTYLPTYRTEYGDVEAKQSASHGVLGACQASFCIDRLWTRYYLGLSYIKVYQDLERVLTSVGTRGAGREAQEIMRD